MTVKEKKMEGVRREDGGVNGRGVSTSVTRRRGVQRNGGRVDRSSYHGGEDVLVEGRHHPQLVGLQVRGEEAP